MLYEVNQKLNDVRDVAQGIMNNEKEIKEIFCVAFQHDGSPLFYYAGNWHSLAAAAAWLQARFIDHYLNN